MQNHPSLLPFNDHIDDRLFLDDFAFYFNNNPL